MTGPDSTAGSSRRAAPIGVFDSGVGGLSVLRHIRQALPHEDLFYVADSAHAPYGELTPEQIRQRVLALGDFLVSLEVKALVVACNTATAAAAPLLRSRVPVPVIAMEPAVKPAAAATRNGIVGVLATSGTLASAQFAALLERFASNIEVVTQPCPGLVECVERGDLSGPEPRALIERYLAPILSRGADTIVLGCTHYPFLGGLIAEIAGAEVRLIETGGAVARQLERRLDELDLRRPDAIPGTERFWTTGALAPCRQTIRQLWHPDARVEML